MSTKNVEQGKFEIIPPIYNVSFEEVFGIGNKDVIKGFLQSMLSIKVEDFAEITYVNEQKKFDERDRVGLVDLCVHMKTGKVMYIAIYMANRPNFRMSKIFTDTIHQYGKLTNYGEISKVEKIVTILIVDADISGGTNYHSKTYLTSSSGRLMDGLVEHHFLELPKVPTEFDGTKICEWAKFFCSKTKKEFSTVAEKDPNIKKAVEHLISLSEDEQNRLAAEREEKRRRDQMQIGNLDDDDDDLS